MTATEELRRMLDERGVEWLDDSYAQLWCTVWDGQDGKQWRMTENQSGMLTELKAWKVTPEQAIAATLGSCNCTNDCTNGERTGTCHPIISDNLNESEGLGDAWANCSECGHLLFVLTDPNSEPPNYCPNCGRKVVDE